MPPLVIPNNKNVTFLMGNRCKMMMIAKLLTCRVLFKKYNGPYHLLLTSYIHSSTFCIKNTTTTSCTSSLLHLLHLFFLSYFSESIRPPKMHLILKIDWQQYIRKDQIMQHIGLNLIGSVLTPNYFQGTGIDLSSKYSYL